MSKEIGKSGGPATRENAILIIQSSNASNYVSNGTNQSLNFKINLKQLLGGNLYTNYEKFRFVLSNASFSGISTTVNNTQSIIYWFQCFNVSNNQTYNTKTTSNKAVILPIRFDSTPLSVRGLSSYNGFIVDRNLNGGENIDATIFISRVDNQSLGTQQYGDYIFTFSVYALD